MLFQSLLCKSCLSLRDVWQSPCRCRHDSPSSPICSLFEVYGFGTKRASILGCVWHPSSGLRQLGISTPLALKTRFTLIVSWASEILVPDVCACPTSLAHRAVQGTCCHQLSGIPCSDAAVATASWLNSRALCGLHYFYHPHVSMALKIRADCLGCSQEAGCWRLWGGGGLYQCCTVVEWPLSYSIYLCTQEVWEAEVKDLSSFLLAPRESVISQPGSQAGVILNLFGCSVLQIWEIIQIHHSFN